VESNKLAARRFVDEVLDGGDVEVLLALFAPGAVRHFPRGDFVWSRRHPRRRHAGDR
jgi:hypothetical protein